MDKVKNHYNALAAGAIALAHGFVSKRALNISSVSTNGFESVLASFVVVTASVMCENYLVEKESHN